MTDPIVGICRFSFLGRGDWGAYRGIQHGSAEEQAVRDTVAAELYRPERLAYRFRTFQTLTLPSIAAQVDADFQFWVLTSRQMPPEWLARLQAACDAVPQARLIVSDAPDVGQALAPMLLDLGRNIQFRLDDDDCLSIRHVELLRRAAHAMKAHPGFAYSLPRALLMTAYAEGPRRYELTHPFHAAGVAARLPEPGRSIFAYGHYALPRRLVAMTEPEPFGSLQLKFAGHDSNEVRPARGNGVVPIDDERFNRVLGRSFPFVNDADLRDLSTAYS